MEENVLAAKRGCKRTADLWSARVLLRGKMVRPPPRILVATGGLSQPESVKVASCDLQDCLYQEAVYSPVGEVVRA